MGPPLETRTSGLSDKRPPVILRYSEGPLVPFSVNRSWRQAREVLRCVQETWGHPAYSKRRNRVENLPQPPALRRPSHRTLVALVEPQVEELRAEDAVVGGDVF